MPNWCSTNMIFYGKNRGLVEDFRNNIRSWISVDGYPNSFGKEWLGNILYHVFGKEFVEKTTYSGYLAYRGQISWLDDYEISYDKHLGYYYFYLDTETAWVPHLKMWKLVLNKLYPNGEIKYAYSAQEPGCNVNMLWDPDCIMRFYPDQKYIINSYCNDEIKYGSIYDLNGEIINSKTAINIVKELFNIDCSKYIDDIDRVNEEISAYLEKKADNKDDDEYVCFRIDVLDICETEN